MKEQLLQLLPEILVNLRITPVRLHLCQGGLLRSLDYELVDVCSSHDSRGCVCSRFDGCIVMQAEDLWHVFQREVVPHVLSHASQVLTIHGHHVASDAHSIVDDVGTVTHSVALTKRICLTASQIVELPRLVLV